ncbi:MAG: hypothetical protein JWM93_191 [Frankiales bacterium]|nr:hypothetical protein [Frankiales bacterium]
MESVHGDQAAPRFVSRSAASEVTVSVFIVLQ